MSLNVHKNFADSLVATAPSPATSGTSLVVTAGQGALFPAVPFKAVIFPAAVGTRPSTTNAEIVSVTAVSTDTFTITRAQESSAARTVVVGDRIAAVWTAGMGESSQGGNDTGDADKLARFIADGSLQAQGFITETTALGGEVDYLSGGVTFWPNGRGGSSLNLSVPSGGLTANRSVELPNCSGTAFVGAMVNFDGTANSNQAATYARTLTTVTVTLINHQHLVGHVVQIDFTSGGALDGTYTVISVIDTSNFTITTAASGTIAAGSTLNLLRNTIRASHGVHSVTDAGTGVHVVNFLTAFPDANYTYCPVANVIGGTRIAFANTIAPTAQAAYIHTYTSGVGASDNTYVMAQFTR